MNEIDELSKQRSKLRKEIEQAINRYIAGNESNTPDFILAEYLMDCLRIFDKAISERDRWYDGENMQTEINQNLNK